MLLKGELFCPTVAAADGYLISECVHRRSNPFGESGDSPEDSKGSPLALLMGLKLCFIFHMLCYRNQFIST